MTENGVGEKFGRNGYDRNLDSTIRNLEEEIQLTINNYENILQSEKKNSSQRAEFLLYLIQSLRIRHNEEIQALNSQINSVESEREQAETMQKQMENIGQGLEHIVEESRKLKVLNESLQKQVEQQEVREKQLDEEILKAQKQLDECRLKADDWERVKIKWNRQKKQLMELIEDAEKAVHHPFGHSKSEKSEIIDENEEQNNQLQELYTKYQSLGAQVRKST